MGANINHGAHDNIEPSKYSKPSMATERSKSSVIWPLTLVKRVSFSSVVFMLIGCFIIITAALQLIDNLTLQGFFLKLAALFSTSFVVIFSVLIMLSIIAITKIQNNEYSDYWSEVGLQVANGISALALTFTLLGISLGIGSLSEQPLTPDNVQALIHQLTQHFSMAFMTTVVGLPTATIIRAIVSVRYQRVNIMQQNETADELATKNIR